MSLRTIQCHLPCVYFVAMTAKVMAYCVCAGARELINNYGDQQLSFNLSLNHFILHSQLVT